MSARPRLTAALVIWFGVHLVTTGEYTVSRMLTTFNIVLFSTASAAELIDLVPQIERVMVASSRIVSLATSAGNVNKGVGKTVQAQINASDDTFKVSEKTAARTQMIRYLDQKSSLISCQTHKLDHSNPQKDAHGIILENWPRLDPEEERLEVKDLWFSYPCKAQEGYNLSGITFTATAGTKLAVVGASGAGKTTLTMALLHMYEDGIRKGTISLNGETINGAQSPLLDRFALVPQSSYLFNTTIAEAIAYAAPCIDMERVERAAQRAHISGFIESLPEGYETRVGDGGTSLSGGQAQRVCIARALYRDPLVLVLDECTSALDAESASAIQQSIKSLNSVIVIAITHSDMLMRIADEILVLEHGRMVQRGPYGALASSPGAFREILQSGQWE